MDVSERIFEEKLKGHCCSEAIMAMGLADMGRGGEADNDLVRAMGAFCSGLRVGLACGTLCAAVSVLCVACDDALKAKTELAPEMTDWFLDRFGAWNCENLLEGDDTRRLTLCPVIVEETYYKLRDMLEDAGAV